MIFECEFELVQFVFQFVCKFIALSPFHFRVQYRVSLICAFVTFMMEFVHEGLRNEYGYAVLDFV